MYLDEVFSKIASFFFDETPNVAITIKTNVKMCIYIVCHVSVVERSENREKISSCPPGILCLINIEPVL